MCAADLPMPIIVLNGIEDDLLARQVVQYDAQFYEQIMESKPNDP
jgi:hypothetical protein